MKVKEFCNNLYSSSEKVVKVYIVDGCIDGKDELHKIGFWDSTNELVGVYQSMMKCESIFKECVSEAEIEEIYAHRIDEYVIAIKFGEREKEK